MGSVFGLTFRFSESGPNGMSHWRFVSRTPGKERNLQLLGRYDYQKPRTAAWRVADYIFPYTLTFTSTSDSLAYPRLGRWSLLALPLNVVLALVVLLFVPGAEGKRRWCAGILTLVCGVYAFIPSLVFRD